MSPNSRLLIMRACRALFLAAVMTLIAVLSYASWTLLQDSKVEQLKSEMLGREINRLRLDATADERKRVSVQKELKEAQNLYLNCQETYKTMSKTMDSMKTEGDTLRQKAERMEKQIKQMNITILKLIQPSFENADKPSSSTGTDTSISKSIQLPVSDCMLWAAMVDMNSVNGMREYQYSTLPDCQAHCIKVSTCVAVDFDIHTVPMASCWVHLKETDLNSAHTYSQPGTTQYRLNRTCLTESTKKDQQVQQQQQQQQTLAIQNSKHVGQQQPQQQTQEQEQKLIQVQPPLPPFQKPFLFVQNQPLIPANVDNQNLNQNPVGQAKPKAVNLMPDQLNVEQQALLANQRNRIQMLP